MTPYELEMCIEIYNEQKIEDVLEKARLCISTAYYTESFQRTEKLKELTHYLNELEENYRKSTMKVDETEEQTQEQMLNQIKVLNALFGGEIKYVTTNENELVEN